MKISARNTFTGTVCEIKKGMTTAHVVIDLGNGHKITASVTDEAVEDLGLKVGKKASAIVKATNVLVAVDD